MNTPSFNAERSLLASVLPKNSIVFDVGANKGDWSAVAVQLDRNARIYSFEPAPLPFQELVQRFGKTIASGTMVCNPMAVSGEVGTAQFFYYDKASTWGSIHRRGSVEKTHGLGEPRRFTVPTTTIDSYCDTLGIRHIHFLKIDVEGNELQVLKGATDVLSKRMVDYIQFEYGGTYIDSGARLKDAYEFLRSCGYTVLRSEGQGFRVIDSFADEFEDFQYRIYVAMAPRHRRRFIKTVEGMFDYQDLFARRGIKARGVIHVGANEGQEFSNYSKAGVDKVVFIEADPNTFARLSDNFANNSAVTCVQSAISDREGKIAFSRMSADQSSSILKPKAHLDIYPTITVKETIEVSTETLEVAINRHSVDISNYNVLAIDVQGAELHVLKGSKNILNQFDAIITEVNYEELYEGCGLIWDIDDFLRENGFQRVEEICPFHPSWGDALYVRRPRFSMRTLGSNGRFANQILQYFFLSYVGKKYDAIIEAPPWVGEQIFNIPESRRISGHYPQIRQDPQNQDMAMMLHALAQHSDADVWGYFQYHTKAYAEERAYFRGLFGFRPEVQARLEAAAAPLKRRGATIVALHLRRGDYGDSYHFIAPSKWYIDALREFLTRLDNPVVYIASDEIDSVASDFAEFNPITYRDLMPNLSEQSFLLDFFVLEKADAVLTSNSSFSFAASMLNENARIFLRPDLTQEKMIPFDPWNSPVLLRDLPS